ncbi:hypothetical protein AK812_SmicGene9240 [Symbiodinium microadriaticum]|uniref:Uncharacterized protein n=1 Tax=Symbiodinium microadriaticum TaxID=2951 RepID=A0A1Q9EJ45_SYMMI|nr:hypothetical protein AK812_SmicGene9240 [Symbiodinium microadriaticum]
MALELEYRNTFIDVKEDFEEMGSSRARAQSSPPGRVRRISFSLEGQQRSHLPLAPGHLKVRALLRCHRLRFLPARDHAPCRRTTKIASFEDDERQAALVKWT